MLLPFFIALLFLQPINLELMLKRIIPSSGETIPMIGLGTWKTFDVSLQSDRRNLKAVLSTMHQQGATLIDSSPMYQRSEEVIGQLTSELPFSNDFFYATKVWTEGPEAGIEQMKSSMLKMKRTVIDLMQIHNLIDWKTHLKTMREWKQKGLVRYIGITHYTDSMHEALEKIIRTEQIDFVQFNYSIFSRNAEQSLLPTAAEKGVATIINRPFGEGSLFAKVKDRSLPGWALDYRINSWSQFFLKYILSHPSVTCVIPATANPLHMKQNLSAGEGDLPTERVRKKMVEYVTS